MSSAKRSLAPSQILTSQSLGASFSSPATNVLLLDNVAIQLNVTTSDAVGTFTVEGSLDHVEANGVISNAGNWVALNLSAVPTLSGSSTSFLLDLNQVSFPWIRVTYTRTSGTGTVNAYISAKAI